MLAGNRAVAAALCAAMIAASTPRALGAPPPPSAAANAAGTAEALAGRSEQRAPLTLVVNGVENTVVIVVLREHDALVTERELRAAGVPLAGAAFVDIRAVRYVSIASLAPGVTYTVDLANLALQLTANARMLPRTSTSFGPDGASRTLATADPSGFLTYSMTSATNGPNRTLDGFLQAGAGGAKRLFLASAAYSGGRARRGLIAVQTESQEHLSRSTIGDEAASTGALGGNVVIGGIGFTRHFEFQPDYLFFPTPGVSGTVLTPTTADIYVNGAYLRSVQLPPGQFDLTDIPLPAGVNVTKVVLRDASGNVRTVGCQVYQTRQLLRKGFTDYDYHAGLVRRDPYGPHDTYGSPAGLGAYRLGLTDSVTVGARYEQTAHVISGGPQIDVGLPIGHLSLEASASRAFGFSGGAYGVAYDIQGGRFAVALSAQTMSANYATVSLDYTMPRIRSITQQSASFPLTRAVSAGISHTTTTFSGQPTADRLDATLNTRLSRRFGLTFSAERDRGGSLLGFGGAVSGSRLSAGLTAAYTLGRSTNVFVQTTNAGGAAASNVTVSKSSPNGPGFGYVVRGDVAGGASASADLNYQTQYADLSLLTGSDSGISSSALTLTGSVVAFKRGIFFTRPISNSYALADVPGFQNLPVFLGTQYEGRTNGRGGMIVPVLSAYSENQIGVDEMQDRFDVVADQPNRSVRPRIFSGVVATFDVHVLRAFSGTVVVHRDGHDVIPAFARLTLARTGQAYASELGSDGKFYFDNISPGGYAATLTGTGVACAFALRIPAGVDPVTKLGVLTCDASP